jgi:hypothetical protein
MILTKSPLNWKDSVTSMLMKKNFAFGVVSCVTKGLQINFSSPKRVYFDQ